MSSSILPPKDPQPLGSASFPKGRDRDVSDPIGWAQGRSHVRSHSKCRVSGDYTEFCVANGTKRPFSPNGFGSIICAQISW